LTFLAAATSVDTGLSKNIFRNQTFTVLQRPGSDWIEIGNKIDPPGRIFPDLGHCNGSYERYLVHLNDFSGETLNFLVVRIQKGIYFLSKFFIKKQNYFFKTPGHLKF